MSHRARNARLHALLIFGLATLGQVALSPCSPAFEPHALGPFLLAADSTETAAETSGPALDLTPAPLLTWTESELPRWTVRVGTVLLERSRLDSYPVATDSVTGDTLLNANSFEFPVRGGVEVAALRRGEFLDIDYRYFGIDEWTSSLAPITFPPGAQLGIEGLGSAPDPVEMTDISYGTQLLSMELNARRNLTERFTVLTGFRYLQLRDNFQIGGSYGPGLFDLDVRMRTRNELYGAQIGADAIFWDAGRLRIEGFGKAGLYGNVSGNLLQEDISILGNLFTLRGNRTNAAFVGDMNFSAVYQLNEVWAVRGGYQLLWVAGVAVAAEQAHEGSLITNTTGVDTSGSAFFHGATVGLERSW